MTMDKTYIAGVGITPFAKQRERSVKDLVREAVEVALKDAGCDAGAVQAAYFATAGQGAIEGQFMVSGQIALGAMGIMGIPVTNVEQIKRFKVLDRDFTIDTGELTPSLKLKRNVIYANLAEVFERLYD